MNDDRKTKQQLIDELAAMRLRVAQMEQSELSRKQTEEALKESEQKYKLLAESMSDIVWIMDMNLGAVYVSPSIETVLGFAPEERRQQSFNEQLTPDSLSTVLTVLAQELAIEEQGHGDPGRRVTLVLEFYHKNGSTRWLETIISGIRDHRGVLTRLFGVSRDITERKYMEDALRKSEQRYLELSIIDEHTQLYNSRHFYVQLEKEMERSNRYEQPLTLLMLDLDQFKAFNDTYGHVEGNYVLSRVGQVIKQCLRETDSAYRYGGDEFTIMLPMTKSMEGVAMAKRIQEELSEEVFSPALGKGVYMTVSIGLSQYKPMEEMKAFVHRVDQFMYQAKHNGRGRICPELQRQEQFSW